MHPVCGWKQLRHRMPNMRGGKIRRRLSRADVLRYSSNTQVSNSTIIIITLYSHPSHRIFLDTSFFCCFGFSWAVYGKRKRVNIPTQLEHKGTRILQNPSPGILGDPGADSGDEEKSKRSEKYMARRKVKNGEKSPWGQCLTRPVPNGRRRSGFWKLFLAPINLACHIFPPI